MARGSSKTDRLASELAEREDALRNDRTELRFLWEDIAHHVMPRKATFTEQTARGVERNRFVLDSTAPRSLELFASFLHTLLNNPAIQWFRIRALSGDRDREAFNDVPAVRQYTEAVEREMLAELSSETVNLYSHLHETYLDVGGFGTGNLFVEAPEGQLRIRSFHLDDVVIDENVHGFVDTVHRQMRLTPRQAAQRWPDRDLGESAQPGKKKRDRVRFLHSVFPADDPQVTDLVDRRVMRRDAPFISVWLNAEDRKVVAQGTFEEFPYMIPRWYKVRGDPYGRSPAMTVMPDIRMANRMQETILRGAEKLVDPPLYMREGSLVSPVRLFPGGFTFGDGQAPEPLIPTGASRIDVGDTLLQQKQAAIRQGFFVPLFVTEDSPVKTATQVLQEVDERNRAVSPMLIRMQAELFHRLILRVFRLMERAGRFPEPPPEMDNAELDIEYVSPLTSSQRQIESLGALRIIESLLPWAQVDPGVLDPFDPDEVAKVVHAGSGAPDALLRSKAEVERVREARREQAQQGEQFSRLIESVKAGADLAKATGQRQR